MIKYIFRDEQLLTFKNAKDAKPQIIGEAIETVRAKHSGELKPEYVWQDAEGNKRHPLYRHFEWNERAAAEAHWTDTARKLIRCVHIISEDTNLPVAAFVSISDKGGVRYHAHAEVMQNMHLMAIVMQQELDRLKVAETRFRSYEHLASKYRDMQAEVSAELSKIRQAAESRPAV